MKKFLTSLIILLLLVGCCLIAAFPTSASDINYDDFDIIDGVIIEYIGEGGDVIIPSVDADGNPITHIDSRAFRSNTEVTSVVISEGIETMGSEVFEFCENLTEVSMPYSLTETGISVFRRCNLYALTIPGQLRKVNHDFSVGGPITDFIISDGVEELSSDCVYGQFTELVLPESVYLIAGHFRGGMAHTIKDFRLTILNPDAEIGVIDGKDEYYEKYGSVGPLTTGYPGCTCKIVIQGLKDSPIKDYVNTYMKDKDYMEKVTTRFVGLDQEELDEIEEQNKARSITKPVTEEDKDENPGTAEEDDDKKDTTTDDKDDVKGSASGDNKLIFILIVVVVVLILIVMIVVVLFVVMNNNKKKKKKKKKKVAAPVEEVVEEVAEVTEETGDEE